MSRRKRPVNSGEQYNNARQASAQPKEFTFEHEGQHYTLPPVSKGTEAVEAGVVIDALMGGGDAADARLGIATLLASGVSPEAMKILRGMGFTEFGKILEKWMLSQGMNAGK
jgi:hypothetical protein